MITMMNFFISFKFLLSNYGNIHYAPLYVLFIFGFPSPRVKTVVYLFKER